MESSGHKGQAFRYSSSDLLGFRVSGWLRGSGERVSSTATQYSRCPSLNLSIISFVML